MHLLLSLEPPQTETITLQETLCITNLSKAWMG